MKADPAPEPISEYYTLILDHTAVPAVYPTGTPQTQAVWNDDLVDFSQRPPQTKCKISPALLAGGATWVLILLGIIIGGFVFLPR